jgi:hypothetical protein
MASKASLIGLAGDSADGGVHMFILKYDNFYRD